MRLILPILHLLPALVLSPLLLGVINRVKAFFGGRKGPPLLQVYYDLFKLLRKGAVYSKTTSRVFRIGPVAGLSAVLLSLALVPFGGSGSVFSFTGDFIFMIYALGAMRFATVLAALDTGSAFEGMGADREVQFALLAELVMLTGLAVLAVGTGRFSLSGMVTAVWTGTAIPMHAAALLVAAAMLIVLLTENARIPVDDPNTHLELTMIHEVMVLDHCGVDLAFIEYGSALKLWLFSALLTGLALPVRTGRAGADMAFATIGVFLTAVLVGVIESTMARLRLRRVPQMLLVALALTLAAFLWVLR